VTVNLTNNLYYSNQTSSTGIYTQKVKIDYLVVDQDASNEYVVNAYDEKGNLLQGGQYFLVEENFEEEKLAVLEMDAIKLTTNGNQVVSAEKMSSTAFTYMCSGLLNEVFDLSDITGFKEFYYGDNLTNLTKCTQVILQKSGDEYVLLPVDSSGKPVSKNTYIVYDHLYTFDITLNSIVNEHSEDNGDVYLWRGSQYYITENLTPTTDDTLQYIDESLTEIQPYTVSVTGRIGDSFEVAEVDELLIYAAVGDRQTFIQDWVNLQKHPSDNGARYYDGYCINDYLHLNSFEDKVNYFAIYENSDGSVSLGAMLPGDHMYSIDMIDFYTTRQPIVKPPIMDAKNIYHIQLRVPSNAVIEMDGELYSGDLTLSGGSATVIYNDQVLADSAFSSVSSSGSQQESNGLSWAKNIVYGYNSSNVIYEPAFDPEVMKITITFMVYGTLTSTTGKEIVYSREEPLTVTETLSREKMLQSFFACPNLRGYDVLLDISAAVKRDVDATTAYNVTITKNWDDSSNFYEVRPNEVTVTLERSLDNGVTWSEFENNVVTITGDGDNAGKSIWTKELKGIDSYIINGNGEIVPYTFRIKSESMVDTGNDDFIYESTINGTTVTNKLDFETELDIQLEKEWVDVNGNVLTGLVPDDVIVHIYQDGKYFSTEYLSAKNNWQSNVYGVPVYKNAKEKYEYTVKVVDEDEEIIEDGQIAAYNSKSFQFSTTDTNVSAGTKVLSLSQVYLQTRTITISNDVTKTFIETYDFTDDSVVFNYTASLKYGDISAVAEGYSSNVSYNEATGEYKFTLATGESAEIQVLDAYTFTVVEDEGNHDYTTTWQIDSGEVNEGRVAVIDYINANMNINFANDTTYYGDVEVQGFQMNTDYSEGAVSEKSPSFRVVSRACEKLKNAEGELLDVVAYGTIYALDEEVNSDYRGNMTLDKAVLANSDYVYSEEEFQEIFYYECKVGTYFGWTARELEDPYYRYYGLTFVMKSYNYATLKQDMTFRAYAKLSDGTIVYGTKIYKTRMYDIANNLYQSKKVGKKEGHEFLYRNVLNLVKMEENRVDICYAMLNAMQVPSTSDIRYTYVNNVNKDIVDYVYCQGKYNYADRQTVDREFVPKRLSEEQLTELLTELNSVRGTNYNNLFDWIYYETENYRDYQGFYKKVPYDWNDSIYNGTNKY